MRCRPILLACFGVLLLGAGCGQSSFIGKRLDNFTAYYNTFYNAEKSLDAGVKATDQGQVGQPIDQDVYLPIFGGVERGTTQRQPFEDAIKKSSDILREHPHSKWVDDAAMVIGKAWFYTQNYVGAEQKFQEVIDLNSRLEHEARFWLARTLIASGQYEAAFTHLQASLNQDGLTRRWEPMLRLALGELHVQRKSWEEAAADLAAGLDGVRDNELAARAQFLLGQVYETLGRYEDAVQAYARVSDFNPFYELSYAAQYSAVRVEGSHGDPDAALRRLRRMERDDKNYEHRGDLAYLRGRVFQAAGRYDDALDLYDELLYDPTAGATTVRGKIHYALAVFYRDVYEEYPLAAAYFDTAKTGLPNPSSSGGVGGRGGSLTQQAYAPAALTDSEEQSRIYGSFRQVMGQISEMDSLLYLGSLDDSTFQARILEFRQQRAKEEEELRRQAERLQTEQQFRQAGAELNAANRGLPSGKQIDFTGGGEAGFLYHKDQVQVQMGRSEFVQRWGNRKLVPNWRRLDAATGVSRVAEGGGEDAAEGEDVGLAEAALPIINVSNVPRDPVSQGEMREKRAVARYELANVLFLSMNRPDSAATWYRVVIEEDAEAPVAQRAYYALAEVQRALGDTLAAQRLYRTILDRYPGSDFTDKVRERLGLAVDEDAVSDTLAVAEAAYDRAYEAWKQQAYRPSLNEMIGIALDYPGTDVAPRALFAAGSVYMEWAVRDSLDLFAPLPLSIPDSVLYASPLFQSPSPASETQPAPGGRNEGPARGGEVPVKGSEEPVKGEVPVKSNAPRTPNPQPPADTPVKQTEGPVQNADPLAGAPDSLALALRDSLSVDSLAIAGASPVMLPDSTGMPAADTTAVAEPEPVRLETLYLSLVNRYPRAPQAPQARRTLSALKERQAALQARADSLAQVAADSLAQRTADSLAHVAADSLAIADTLVLAADSLAIPDSTQQAVLDTLHRALPPGKAVPRDSSVVESPGDRARRILEERRQRSEQQKDQTLARFYKDDDDEDEAPVVPVDSNASGQVQPRPASQPPGPGGGIDWSQGGWTIHVHTAANQEEAATYARFFGNAIRQQGYAVDVYSALVRDAVEYRVGVGLFATEREANEAFESLRGRLPGEAQVVQIPKAE